jgi:hypothetical protein
VRNPMAARRRPAGVTNLRPIFPGGVVFTGVAAITFNNADAREPQCPLPSFSTLCFRFSSHSSLLARFWARFRPNRILINELAEDGMKI